MNRLIRRVARTLGPGSRMPQPQTTTLSRRIASEIRAHKERLETVASAAHEYPALRFAGRGIVIPAGNARYFTNAYVCVSMLRALGCRLPVQFWHLGPDEMTADMKALVSHLDVSFVDGRELRKTYPARVLNGWEMKPYAILHSPFQEVLLLDADNVPVKDPEYLFEAREYQATGAIFWPDRGRLPESRAIWSILDVPYRDEREVESGQIVVDKRRCWHALQITMHLNEWSDFYYHYIHGDKETFHLAWRKADQDYAMPSRGVRLLEGVFCQHDFAGERVFQHRNFRKWRLEANDDRVPGFLMEDDCLRFLNELRERWKGR